MQHINQIEVTVDQDKINYQGFEIEYQIDCDSCECCGTRHTITWDAYNKDIKEHVFGASTLAEMIKKIDNKEYYER